jgi:para-nitrobenzyl esterase
MRKMRNPICPMMIVALLVTFGALGVKAIEMTSRHKDPAIVRIETGKIRGLVTDDYRTFQGVPYAAPPKGKLRWRAPKPALPWDGIKDATMPGSMCPQMPSSYADVASTEEDCLFLNVTTPRHASFGDNKPVMVWIHGDGGIGAGSFFNPQQLVTQGDVIAVTINYRLNIFGTFGYPGLKGSGTFGLQDQQAALRWVKRNIAAFGGDPQNVTIFGESYGGLSVGAHLISPDSKGLFHRAIIQSGFLTMDMPAESVFPGVEAAPYFGWRITEEIEGLGADVASQLNCDRNAIECLRHASVEDLLARSDFFRSYAYGNEVIPGDPTEIMEKGDFHRVPILSGNTKDEHRLFVGLFRILAGQPVTNEQYPHLLRAAFGEHADEVTGEYPLSHYESPAVAWATILTDRMWAKSTFRQNRLYARNTITYAYEFADRNAPMFLPFPPDFPPGAFHASEVSYIFRDDEFQTLLTPAQIRLSNHMIAYWSNFARNGDPNGRDLPIWEEFTPTAQVSYVQSLATGQDGIQPVDFAKEHKLDFWNNF